MDMIVKHKIHHGYQVNSINNRSKSKEQQVRSKTPKLQRLQDINSATSDGINFKSTSAPDPRAILKYAVSSRVTSRKNIGASKSPVHNKGLNNYNTGCVSSKTARISNNCSSGNLFKSHSNQIGDKNNTRNGGPQQ